MALVPSINARYAGRQRPNELSFFTLPPELRNMIYKETYKFDDAVWVVGTVEYPRTHNFMSHYGQDFSVRICRVVGDRNSKLPPALFQHLVDPIIFISNTMPQVIVRDQSGFLPGKLERLGLFGTCTQADAEAASYFLTYNKFVVSRVITIKTERPTATYEYHDRLGTRLMLSAAKFLVQLGSHAHFLNNLEIDIGTLCPATCHFHIPNILATAYEFVDVTPLLLQQLERDRPVKISFVEHQQSRNKVRELHLLSASSPSECDPHCLTTIMGYLSRDSELRKYRRLIAQVLVHRRSKEVLVVYMSTACHGTPEIGDPVTRRGCGLFGLQQRPMRCTYWDSIFHPKRGTTGRYHACKDNISGLLQWTERGGVQRKQWFKIPRATLDSLPCHIIEKILKYISPEEEITIEPKKHDNNLGPASGLLFLKNEMFEANFKRSHCILVASYLKNHSFKLVCTVEKPDVTFNDFDDIAHWFDARSHVFNGTDSRARPHNNRGQDIYLARDFMLVLVIRPDQPIWPRPVRIGIISLIILAMHLPNHFRVCFDVEYPASRGGGRISSKTTLSLGEIRRLALVTLTEAENLVQGMPCPEVWLDARGEPLGIDPQPPMPDYVLPSPFWNQFGSEIGPVNLWGLTRDHNLDHYRYRQPFDYLGGVRGYVKDLVWYLKVCVGNSDVHVMFNLSFMAWTTLIDTNGILA